MIRIPPLSLKLSEVLHRTSVLIVGIGNVQSGSSSEEKLERIVPRIVGERCRCICEYCNDARASRNLRRNLSKDKVFFHSRTGALRKFLRHPKPLDTSILAIPLSKRQRQLCDGLSGPSIVLHAIGEHWRSIGLIEPTSSHMEVALG